jgi:hypothetical protein
MELKRDGVLTLLANTLKLSIARAVDRQLAYRIPFLGRGGC